MVKTAGSQGVGDKREEVVRKLVAGKSTVSREEAAAIGVDWPLAKGWRKAFMASIGKRTFFQQQRDVYLSDMGISKDGGWLIRTSATGRAHICVNGQALCRVRVTSGKYITTNKKPDNVSVCNTCEGLSKVDPENNRSTKKMSAVFYSSWEWKKARYEALKRFGAKCMLCGSTERVVVDHIKPRRFYPELELDQDNLQILCNECNQGKSFDDETDFRGKS